MALIHKKIQTPIQNIVGVKFIKSRSYYEIQSGTKKLEYQPVNMVYCHERDFIKSVIKQACIETRVKFIRTNNQPLTASKLL